jgi:hypothetical protein
MILRSVTSRLVFFYCLLLVLLGAGFLAFTVFSFRYYARESLNSTLGTRAQEIRQVSEGLLEQPDRLRRIIERRFSPESEGRFIRISAPGRTLYLSPMPVNQAFDPKAVPILPIPPTGTPSLRTWEGLALVSREF